MKSENGKHTYYEFRFYNAMGKFIGGASYGFRNPDKEVRAWCVAWMESNKNLRPVRWTYKFIGGSLAA